MNDSFEVPTQHKENTLGFMEKQGLIRPFPLGFILTIIHNQIAIPMAVTRVTKEDILLKCPCGHPQCSRRLKMSLLWKGVHPQKETKEL